MHGNPLHLIQPIPLPDITVRQGDVEDWIIENRTTELHAFHIHQLHFALMDWNGVAVNEPFLRDTINVPYFSGKMPVPQCVRVRMDFRDPDSASEPLCIRTTC